MNAIDPEEMKSLDEIVHEAQFSIDSPPSGQEQYLAMYLIRDLAGHLQYTQRHMDMGTKLNLKLSKMEDGELKQYYKDAWKRLLSFVYEETD